MARFDIRETPSLDRRPEPEPQIRPERVPERPGHRRHYDPLQEKHTIAERKDAAVADVSHYRVVAVADIVRERFGGNPYAARKALDQMKAAGWVTERTLEGPEGGKYRVLSPTTTGAREARTQGLSWGMDPQQRAWDGAGSKSRDMGHDVAIYRAARAEQARIEERGRTLRRIRTDAELKAAINSRSEAARQQGGREAADRARFEAAEALHLPIRNGQVQYPDAQLEFSNPMGSPKGTSTSKSSPATTAPVTSRPRPRRDFRCTATGASARSRSSPRPRNSPGRAIAVGVRATRGNSRTRE